MNRVQAAAGLALAALATGCDGPGAAQLVPGSPPPEASATCRLPYERLPPGPALWSDLDVGSRCTVYLESDECVFGIFEDCVPDGSGAPREWQGRTDDRSARLTAAFRRPAPERAPGTCQGHVEEVDGVVRIQAACASAAPGGHAGVLLEVPAALAAPWGRTEPWVPLAAPPVDGDPDGTGGLWIVTETELLRWSGDPVQTIRPLADRPSWVRSVDAAAVVGFSDRWLRSDDGAARELPGLTDAAWRPGRLVAVGERDTDGGWVGRFDPATLVPLEPALELAEPALAVGFAAGRAVVVTTRSVLQVDVDAGAPAVVASRARPAAGPATRVSNLGDGRAGFGGTCHRSGLDAPGHCLFVTSVLVDAPLTKLGVPDTERLLPPIRGPDGGLLLAGTAGVAVRASVSGSLFTADRVEGTGPWSAWLALSPGRVAALGPSGILPISLAGR